MNYTDITAQEQHVATYDGTPTRPFDRVLDLLTVKSRNGRKASAYCPAHNDHDPSLSIAEGRDGRVLLHCHAGCTHIEILAAIGLEEADLFTGPPNRLLPTPAVPVAESRTNPATLELAASATDWESAHQCFLLALTRDALGLLARQLGLPTAPLLDLEVGWDTSQCCWTFPERNAMDQIIGISRRFPDGSKRMMAGGKRGLYLPRSLLGRAGPVLLVEGASDTAAVTALGLAGIGRPSCDGGVDLLAGLLSSFPLDRRIIVVGEMDAKTDGRWPGRAGAEKVARELANRLRRNVEWSLPPDGAKDVREWFTHEGAPKQ